MRQDAYSVRKNVLSRLICAFGSQKRLGEQAGVSQKAVSKWFNSVTNIPIERALLLERLAKAKGLKGVTAKKLTPHIKW